MLRIMTLIIPLLASGPALAQSAQLTTTNEVVNAMMEDWSVYDELCRGTLPENGADGFCGARDYIGWSLNQSGVCLRDGAQPEGKVVWWALCDEGEDEQFPDPAADERAAMEADITAE